MATTRCRGCSISMACGRSVAWPRATSRCRRGTWNGAVAVGWLVVFMCLATDGVVAAKGDGRLMRLRRRAQDQPLDELSWSNLRRFVCGSVENVKCMNDERFNQLRPDFLRKLSARFNQFIPITSPAEAINIIPLNGDSMPEVYSNDVNIWNSLNLSGRREGPFYVDEPDFVLTQEENAMPPRMFDYVSDPFIPQRGRRHSSNEHRNSQQALTMATHYNGVESAGLARHIHQVSSSVDHQQLLQSQPQGPNTDRVDDNANFRRFLRRLLKPDILAVDGNSGPNIANDSSTDDTIGEEGLELQTASHQPHPPPSTWILPLNTQAIASSQHNLSPPPNPMQQLTSSKLITQPTHHWVSQQQRNASRDTFYLARGSHIHQQQIQ